MSGGTMRRRFSRAILGRIAPASLARILRKLIVQGDPGKAAFSPGMILGPDCFGIIQAAQGYVDGVRRIHALIGQRGSAARAERAQDLGRRGIKNRPTAAECKLVPVDSGPADKRRAARTPASSAMAMSDSVRRPQGAVTNRAAKTAAFDSIHKILLDIFCRETVTARLEMKREGIQPSPTGTLKNPSTS
jgi:hypothetical protein